MALLFWTLQLLLGFFFALHGTALIVSPPSLREVFGKVSCPKVVPLFAGLCELLGGVSLIPGG